MRFTFKKITDAWDRYESFMIKLKNKEVGSINENDRGWYRINLLVKDENIERGFKWVKLNKQCETVQEAKDFLNENIMLILERHQLHFLE